MSGISTLLAGSRSTRIRDFRFLFCTVCTLALCLTLSQPPASAQAVFGSLVGNVTDSSGGTIAGAAVKIILTQTNESRAAMTNSVGDYTFSTLTPGTYTVEVTKEGFRAFSAGNVLVNQNNVVRVDAQLSIGATSERVEVTAAGASALETDRADVHSEISGESL